MRISRKKFRACFEILVSGPTPVPRGRPKRGNLESCGGKNERAGHGTSILEIGTSSFRPARTDK